ncbi:MAG TPA: Ig-like domain-containing protein [Gemmatimonadales bacterium]|nr:Ig-like domain-containing protein [Gemmatimonadales bacterium]
MIRATIIPWRALPLRPALLAGTAAVLVGACSSDLMLPDDPGARTLALAVADGDAQQGRVAEVLSRPIVVRVADQTGAPVAGVKLVFVPGAGATGASVLPDTAVTDAGGRAGVLWVLGTVAGRQTLEAHLAEQPAAPPSAVFTAEAAPGAPDTLQLVSGDGQVGFPGTQLPQPLTVRVVDRFGNGVAGARVRWRVESGRGETDPSIATTGGDGQATAVWTLGMSLKEQRVEATVDGVAGSPATFRATPGQFGS